MTEIQQNHHKMADNGLQLRKSDKNPENWLWTPTYK